MEQLMMIRDNLENIPEFDFERASEVHTLKPGEERAWEWICSAAFGRKFNFDETMRSAECYTPDRILMGKVHAQVTSTASAWTGRDFGEKISELYWVASHPSSHGDGMGKRVIAAALRKMKELGYERSFLLTDDFRLSAIHLYKQFGFRPVFDKSELYDEGIRPEPDSIELQQARRERWAAVDAELAAYKPVPNENIVLWENGAPLFDESIVDQKQPNMTHFPVKGSRGCVIVCPGGGYTNKACHEGAPIARMINAGGVSAFVLDYRVKPYTAPCALLDVNRAVRVARSMGYEKVGVLGFSAGGHLSAISGTMYDRGNPDAEDPIERLSCRPDAILPCYAVISFAGFTHVGSRINFLGEEKAHNMALARKYSADLHVTEDTPPVFMWHTASDNGVPVENSLRMAAECVRHNVPVELHVFPEGQHGLGLAGGKPAGQWNELCQNFLRELGFADKK